MEYFVANINMVTIECHKCHIIFAVPQEFNDEQIRLKGKGIFFCPSGHGQSYTGKSEETKLKERLNKEISCCLSAREEANALERSNRALKGHLARARKKGCWRV